MIIAEIIVTLFTAYSGAGILFALWFVIFKIGDFDPAARDAGILFRILIFFGVAALWAVVAAKLLGRRRNDG